MADAQLLAWDASVSPPKLTVQGDWTLDNYVVLGEQIGRLNAHTRSEKEDSAIGKSEVDLTGLTAIDTAGASRLYELLGEKLAAKVSSGSAKLSPERRELL